MFICALIHKKQHSVRLGVTKKCRISSKHMNSSNNSIIVTILQINGTSLRTDSVLFSLSGQGIKALDLLPHRTTVATWLIGWLLFLVDGAVDMLSEILLWHYVETKICSSRTKYNNAQSYMCTHNCRTVLILLPEFEHLFGGLNCK